MSLTLLYRGKNIKFARRLTNRQMVSGLVLVFGLSMISSRATHPLHESQSRVVFSQTAIEAQREEVARLKANTEQKLTGITLQLAELQSQMLRVNALGARLVEQAELSPEEFSFSELPAMGGPSEQATEQVALKDDILDKIDTLLSSLESKSQQLLALESILLNHHIDEQRYLAGRPINSGWLSSRYGIRKDPFSGLPAMHKGLDFAGKDGEPVVATGAGIVTWAGERYGYGNLVEVDHGDGLVTRYGHNKQVKVKIGDVVTKGEVLALMGSTGRSTGAHVHYEVLRNGTQQDPLPFVYRKNNKG